MVKPQRNQSLAQNKNDVKNTHDCRLQARELQHGAWLVAPFQSRLMIGVMKKWMVWQAIGILAFALPASGQVVPGSFKASTPGVRSQVIAVIAGQLAAFRSGDIQEAYGYASAGLRAQFPAGTFAAIVRENYPSIWASTRAEFGIVRDDGTRATVLVQVFSEPDSVGYDYGLLRERGGWKIGSVVRREAKSGTKL